MKFRESIVICLVALGLTGVFKTLLPCKIHWFYMYCITDWMLVIFVMVSNMHDKDFVSGNDDA